MDSVREDMTNTAPPSGEAGGVSRGGAPRKVWRAPKIVQHDVLETVAALCQDSPGLLAKATPTTCDITQT